MIAIDLFAGAGGATTGLKAAGFSVASAVELDSAAAASYRKNHTEVEVRELDIRECSPADVAHELGLGQGELSLLKACPPCQRFSSLSTSKLEPDPMAELVLEPFRWVSTLRPAVFSMENVPGLRRSPLYYLLLRKLRGLGYRCRDYDVNAAALGVPQRRKRLILVAARSDLGKRPPEDLIRVAAADPPNAADVIASCEMIDPSADPLHVARIPSPKVLERIKAIPPNGSRFDLPNHLQLSCHKRLSNRHATGPYGRIPLTGPAPTMTTRCTTPSCGQFVHPTLPRGITLREAALLQSFPHTYHLAGSYEQRERQIGNAIPAEMVRVITEEILERLL